MRRPHLTSAGTVLSAALFCGGCGSSPSNPVAATPVTPSPKPAGPTSGHIVDALSLSPAASVAIMGAAIVSATSGADGSFTLTPVVNSGGTFVVTFTQPDFVARTTNLAVPGPEASVSLIPVRFDLSAFDQMMRSSQVLRRWIAAPALKVETRVPQFTNASDNQFITTSDTLTDAELSSVVQDLTWALPQLTGNHFQSFASITIDSPPAGTRVLVQNPGVITFARYNNLEQSVGTPGNTRSEAALDASMTAAAIMIDQVFERFNPKLLRSLRSHELGHALGYHHVSTPASVMDPDHFLEPTDFDRQAASIAFQRPPGNRSPDTDPSAFSINVIAGMAPRIWNER